jgi:choline dehydrogenase-like flavoprotein
MVGTHWDVIVVGAGMGGATLGFALAKAGKRVLFCEKGRSHLSADGVLRGGFAEDFFGRPEAPDARHAEILARAGRCWDPIEDRSGPRPRRYIPYIGAGAGGSSALYGMALERFDPGDFTPRRHYPDAPPETTLPDAWPLTYGDLRPYYRAAEALFGVRGAADPLRAEHLDPLPPAPPMTGAARELFAFLQSKGLHPYALPMACARVPDCLGCQGFLCAKGCKIDAVRACLAPAVAAHGAEILDECRVETLEATREAVTGVVCSRRGESFTLRGDLVVLAAGALETPCLLLRSASPAWPDGLANESGLVGRNLMRHFVDLYAVFLKAGDGLGGGLKELAFNDDYLAASGKRGTVQSFGALPSAPVIVAGMEKDLRDGSAAWLTPAFRLAKPLLRRFLAYQLSRSLILASIMEDLPTPRTASPRRPTAGAGLILEYRLRPHDTARIEAWRRKLGGDLRPYKFMLLKQAENNERIAHACGTCRFGTDPRTSVLDPENRAHGLSNLYVVDSSFFPSSAGTNPALTIAANALRVADRCSRPPGTLGTSPPRRPDAVPGPVRRSHPASQKAKDRGRPSGGQERPEENVSSARDLTAPRGRMGRRAGASYTAR